VYCSTSHSLAYRHTVKQLGLVVGDFSFRDIKEYMPYEVKQDVIERIKEFCLSEHTSLDSYFEANKFSKQVQTFVTKYVELMYNGKIPCSHDFYLKVFHIMLAEDSITFDTFDLVMIDESGDLSNVTLEIFKLLPAHKKIAVGDMAQNLYSFNYTVNAFTKLTEGIKLFSMTKSFRVNARIAKGIERFCVTYIDPDFKFVGVDNDTSDIKSRMYLTRTNNTLISKIIELNEANIPYGLIRKASEIFKLHLIMAGLKYQGSVTDNSYKFLQADYDEWYESTNLQNLYKNPYGYLMEKHKDDNAVVNSIKTVVKYTRSSIFDAYNKAKAHEKYDQSYLLATCHSVKGLDADEVYIADDLNSSIHKLNERMENMRNAGMDYVLNQDDITEVNLYYVACSRAKKVLLNAEHLRYD
jgi:superfamily I DNA/RNA helicase